VPDPTTFDALVRLASFGATGIAILIVFWVGFVLIKLPKDASVEQHKSLRLYMGLCLCITLLSFICGLLNARHNADETKKASERATALNDQLEKAKSTQSAFRMMAVKTDETFKAMDALLESKELHNPAPSVKQDVQTLKKYLGEARSAQTDALRKIEG
jgi:biopolymer transport protein ExbB/TolQ